MREKIIGIVFVAPTAALAAGVPTVKMTSTGTALRGLIQQQAV
jgi:hypothetical protein